MSIEIRNQKEAVIPGYEWLGRLAFEIISVHRRSGVRSGP
jgi:hypothetical protein